MLNILLQTQQADPVSLVSGQLFNYGILGVFAFIMMVTIWYLTKEYRRQNDNILATYKEQITNITGDRAAISNEKEEISNRFLSHLQETESRLLDIVNENSKAFNRVAESNEGVSAAVGLLVKSIENRNSSSYDLHQTISKLIQHKQDG